MADRTPGDAVSVSERSEAQAAYEAALAEVEDTILNIESAIRRAERAESALPTENAFSSLSEALTATRRDLVAVRKRLQQAAYFAAEESGLYGDQLAMFEVPDDDGGQPSLL